MTENKICPNCGHSNKSSARHCAKCGTPIKKHKLDTIEKILIAAGFLLFIFFISWIVSSSTASELRTANIEKANRITALDTNLNSINLRLKNCKTDYQGKVAELNTCRTTEKQEYDKVLSDFNIEFQQLIKEVDNIRCGIKQLDLDLVNINSAGFSNYYILKDKSNCFNNGLLYTQMLAKSKVNDQYGLILTESTKGIINLDVDNNYTIFIGLYFGDLAVDYNGDIFEFGQIDNNYSLYKDQNNIYFKENTYGTRTSTLYDINYNSINYFKIGINDGNLFVKNYTMPKFPNDTIDSLQTKDFGYVGDNLVYGKDATTIPNKLKYIQIGPGTSGSERIADLFVLKAHNVDLRDKDLNYFLDN